MVVRARALKSGQLEFHEIPGQNSDCRERKVKGRERK
jgi:hypothetical protein